MEDHIVAIAAGVTLVLLWSTTVAGMVWWLSNQFSQTRHTLFGAMDMRFSILNEKIDKLFQQSDHKADKNYESLDKRIKRIEFYIAKKNGVILEDLSFEVKTE